jgi:hypothetical protein
VLGPVAKEGLDVESYSTLETKDVEEITHVKSENLVGNLQATRRHLAADHVEALLRRDVYSLLTPPWHRAQGEDGRCSG